MRVIKLCSGEGNGIDAACLMTASNMLIGRGEDGDKNWCVCPLLREFIIQTNDAMPDDLRAELYGPLVFEILGTRNDDHDVILQRAFAFADWSVRVVTPISLRACGFESQAVVLEQLAPIAVANAANAVAVVADAYESAYASAYWDASAYASVRTVSAVRSVSAVRAVRAALAANTADVADLAASATTAAAYAASAATYVTNSVTTSVTTSAALVADATENIRRLCPEIILRVAAIGDLRPKSGFDQQSCAMTADELATALSCC